MANRIVSVHAGIYGIGIYAIMLPSGGFSVAHCDVVIPSEDQTPVSNQDPECAFSLPHSKCCNLIGCSSVKIS